MWCEGGPIFYRHRRVGRGGVHFDCLKFRTMVVGADKVLKQVLARNPELRREWMRSQKLRKDPRITRVGAFLRRTSLDELPQLWNVIRGDMSLVGPRPVVKEELPKYGRQVRHYLSVTPGVTGLWQVMGRNTTTYKRRVALDAYYARKQSLWLDVRILMKTLSVVIAGHGAC
jgi:lipopolysaccharide/colanic/teichoic acid biosynthesis glycosyltransferase